MATVPSDVDPIFALQRMPAGTDEAREIVDRNIEKLDETVRAWKTYRNTLSVISRLPRELLVQIFLHLRNAVVASFDNASAFYPPASGERNKWIVIGHVCRHWRDVALYCKALWVSICVTDRTRSFAFSELQLQRSHPLPIDLTATYARVEHRSWVMKLSTREPRINVNKLVLSLDNASDVLARLNLGSATLRYLCLQYADEVPKLLFGEDAPELRQIRIANCSKVAWDAGIFWGRHITHLVLENQSAGDSPSWNQFEQILLSVAHSIEVLAITSAFPRDIAAKASTINCKPRLARLQRLEVRGKPACVNAFLDSIQVPSTALIDAEIYYQASAVQLLEGEVMASTVGRSFLDFFAALRTSTSSSCRFKRLTLVSEQWNHTLGLLSVHGYLTCNPNGSQILNEPFLKLKYTYNNPDMRFRGVGDRCASCGQKWHTVLAKHGEPRQPLDVSLCDGCMGPCHYRPWFSMLVDEDMPIPGLSLDELEVLELRQTHVQDDTIARVPTGLWRAVSHLPKLRDITIHRFCAGRFGELWMNDATSFPALQHLKFDAITVPPILIKRLRDGLDIRQGNPERHLQSVHFTDYCNGVSTQDLEDILGKYVPTLRGPRERAYSTRAPLEWPPPPEETAEARFNRRALELGYTQSQPPSPEDCAR